MSHACSAGGGSDYGSTPHRPRARCCLRQLSSQLNSVQLRWSEQPTMHRTQALKAFDNGLERSTGGHRHVQQYICMPFASHRHGRFDFVSVWLTP